MGSKRDCERRSAMNTKRHKTAIAHPTQPVATPDRAKPAPLRPVSELLIWVSARWPQITAGIPVRNENGKILRMPRTKLHRASRLVLTGGNGVPTLGIKGLFASDHSL